MPDAATFKRKGTIFGEAVARLSQEAGGGAVISPQEVACRALLIHPQPREGGKAR